MTYSPAPWRVDGVEVFSADDKHVVWELGDCAIEDDARLIAAAPDLLEALQGLLADIQDYQRLNHLGGEDNHWQVRARAAIAKAEGQS